MKATVLAMLVSLSAVVGAAQGRGAAARPQDGKVLDEKLLTCVKSGDANCVAQALAEGADADAADGQGVPALVTAAEGRSARVVRLLLEAGAGVDKGWQGEGAPLCRAALFGRVEIVETLLESGAKVSVICDSDHGDSPLMEALRGAMLSAMPGDVKEGLVADLAGAETDGDEADSRGGRVRESLSVPHGDLLAVARLLLARGADVNVVAKCDAGETALVYAAMSANVEMVRELLARGADVNRGTPALTMLRLSDLEEAKARRLALPALSKEQAAMLAWTKETAAARAEIRRLLKSAGAKEDVEEDEGEAAKPADEAAEEAAGAMFNDVIQKDDVEDFTRLVDAYAGHPLGAAVLPEALRNAVIFQRTAMIKILLERGASPNPVRGTPRGDTPLMQAAGAGSVEYVRMLLDAGADLNAKNEDGQTALDLAEGWAGTSEEHRAVVKLLRARGARSSDR